MYFLLDFCLDLVSLILAGKLCRLRFRKRRIVLGSLSGAAFSLAVVLISPGKRLKFFLTVVNSFLMVLISFGKGKPIRIVRRAAVLWAAGGLIGGVFSALMTLGALHRDKKTFILVLSVSVCAVVLMARIILRRPTAAVSFVKVSFSGRIAAFSGLVDSGNLLRDPISGTPVMIVSPDVAKKLLNADELSYLAGEDPTDVPRTLADRVRMIPSRSVGSSGLLRAFRPDFVTVDGAGRDVLLAVTPPACDLGQYDGIIPSSVAVPN